MIHAPLAAGIDSRMESDDAAPPAPATAAPRPWEQPVAVPRLAWGDRLSIKLERARRWEFWPAWLYYLPIVMWILWLGLRHRRPTVFTAANPALDAGGVVGERKHQGLLPLQQAAPDLVARCLLLDGDAARNISAAIAFSSEVGLPLVLKPDIGQRGRGVFIARDVAGLRDYLQRHDGAVIAQRHVAGEEFGIFIARMPGETRVRILSIVHKTFPEVVGDGHRTLQALILAHPRARLSASLLLRSWAHALPTVPAAGARMALVEIGSHCRGSLFLDATAAATEALVESLTRLADALPGYCFGRIDLRVPSLDALRLGEGLQVLELNGVTAESAHIYHPDTPLLTGYRALFAQWSEAFAIGAANAARGAAVTGPLALLALFRKDLQRHALWF